MFDQYIGVIKALGFNFTPEDWGKCSGALLGINQFTSLFSLLGCQFGGDCRISFGLPDLRGRSPMGYGFGPGLSPRVLGQQTGIEMGALNSLTMPYHTHATSYAASAGNDMTLHVSTAPGKKKLPAMGDYIAPPASGLGSITNNMFIAPGDVTEAEKKTIGGVQPGSGGFQDSLFTIGMTPPTTWPVDVIQPSLAVNYCICMEGLYPSRS